MIAVRLVLLVVVVNHLAMIPHVIITVASIVISHLPLAPSDHHRPRQSYSQNHHRKIPG
jgi:hypothetical protein